MNGFDQFRPRPPANPELGFHVPSGIKIADLAPWSAFPSDHAALFIDLAAGLFEGVRNSAESALRFVTRWHQ